MHALLALLFLTACAQNAPAPQDPSAAPDSAGLRLMEVWKLARRKHPDAVLVSISGKTDSRGLPLCSPLAPFQNGWRYSFFSPQADEFLMMAECGGKIAGPLRQMRAKTIQTDEEPISGRFVDSDVAMRTLEESGISLDPSEHGAMGKRPFSLTLHRLEDEKFKPQKPAVWKVEVGNKMFFVDAVYNERLSPQRYGITLSDMDGSTATAQGVTERPKRAKVYTAKKDFDRVIAYAKKRFPDAQFMAIEGFTDAWGGCPCTGEGDGWAFYFYNPAKQGYDVVYACNGKIGPGPSQYIPVDFNAHTPVNKPFTDTDVVVDNLLSHNAGALNEGMGRRYTAHAVLLLRQYKKAPMKASGLWEVDLLWQLTIGRQRYQFDAKTGKLLQVQDF
ncbi:MAG: hypothetical protein WC728_12185 [Elusimicrobiota bacterium]